LRQLTTGVMCAMLLTSTEELAMKSSKWVNSAARRRNQAKYRRVLCRLLGCPIDSCYSTGELLRDARQLQAA